jgi:hypothetical protein
MIIVQVRGYDCCAYTHSIWYHPDLPKGTKISELGLDSKDFAEDREPDNLIKALQARGFKGVKDQAISYGGNY